jgi:anti-anti-sigma regulatory factor
MASADEVRARLYDAAGRGASSLTVDLGELRFLDSAGVELLFRLREDLAARQMPLILIVPPQAPIRRALEVMDGGAMLLPAVAPPAST